MYIKVLVLYQKFDLKNETMINKRKKIQNLGMWLLVWYANSPPSVEYIAKKLIIPNIKIQKNKIGSTANILSLKFKCDWIEPCLNIILSHLFV